MAKLGLRAETRPLPIDTYAGVVLTQMPAMRSGLSAGGVGGWGASCPGARPEVVICTQLAFVKIRPCIALAIATLPAVVRVVFAIVILTGGADCP